MYDEFVARLRCLACGSSVEARIQTHIRSVSADASSLRVGDEIGPQYLTTDNIVDTGYLLVNPPEAGGPIRLLGTWICQPCGTEPWAMVEIADGKIRSIDAVELDRATLEDANFIADVDAELLAEGLDGRHDADGATVVERLRRGLAAS